MANVQTRITADEISRRRAVVRRANANNRLEGIMCGPEDDHIFEAYIRGEIDVHEIMPRVKAQLGIP